MRLSDGMGQHGLAGSRFALQKQRHFQRNGNINYFGQFFSNTYLDAPAKNGEVESRGINLGSFFFPNRFKKNIIVNFQKVDSVLLNFSLRGLDCKFLLLFVLKSQQPSSVWKSGLTWKVDVIAE